MHYKALFSMLLLAIFSGCGEEKIFTCKDYAEQSNYVYLDENLSPIVQGESYVVPKGVAMIEPVVELSDISFEFTSVVLESSLQCSIVKQDVNDTNLAQIIFE